MQDYIAPYNGLPQPNTTFLTQKARPAIPETMAEAPTNASFRRRAYLYRLKEP
jgi:hypothetical protein